MLDIMGETIRNPGDHASTEKKVLSEELSMQMNQALGQRVEALPPYPLTPAELEDNLCDTLSCPRDDVTVLIPNERDYLERTAVGQYIQEVEGNIARFYLIYNNTEFSFVLVPDISKIGFGWYSLGPNDERLAKMAISGENRTTLKELVNTPGGNTFLDQLPDRIIRASSFLRRQVSPKYPSPTPDGWVTTMCEHRDEGDFLAPRYHATFVHQATSIVLETEPVGSVETDLIPLGESGGESELLPTREATVDSEHDDQPDEEETISQREPTNTWYIHFANDELATFLSEKYTDPIPPGELYALMMTVSRYLDGDIRPEQE